MSEFKVFYSWQSDLPNGTNRTFIQKALQLACENVAANPEVEESPRLDQDTQGVPGAPSIPQVIIEKINACQVFVADVTLCFTGPNGKLAPNPNVAYELGYAVARLGWERVVLVVNTVHGRIEDLPFDLEKRRAMAYAAEEGEEDRSEGRKELAARLTGAIEAIARMQPVVTKASPAEAARDAVANQTPDRISRVRAFNRWFIDELDAANPGKDEPAEFVESLQASRHLMAQYSVVAEAAALAEDPSSIRELWRRLEDALNKYDVPPGHRGFHNEQSHDWWKFHGYEMCVILTAHLLGERKLEMIGELVSTVFVQTRWASSENRTSCDYRYLSLYVKRVYNWHRSSPDTAVRSLFSPAGHLLHQLHMGGATDLPDWELFCEADFLLALIGRSGRLPKDREPWHNVTHVYMGRSPRFLVEAASMPYFNELRLLLIKLDVHGLRTYLEETWAAMTKIWDRTFERHTPAEGLIEAIGTR